MTRLLGALLLAACAQIASAQTWPAKPVKFFVAGAAGSAPDIIARLVGEELTKMWGQQIVVENRVGAAGNLGTAIAAKAPADGYNFLFGQAAPLALNQYTFKSLDFDPEKDFVPVVNAGLSPMMIAINNDLPAKFLADLIALAKTQPGKINFATSSERNIPHLTGEMLGSAAGVRLTHVPYKSNAQAAAETSTGLTQIYIDGIPPIIGLAKAGRLRVLAVTSAKRLPNFPDIPTVAETLPGFQIGGWFAILAPVGTPRDVIDRFNRDANAVLRDAKMAERLQGLGVYHAGGTPQELAQFMQSERGNYARVVKAAGIAPE